jgi:hypothetical protein
MFCHDNQQIISKDNFVTFNNCHPKESCLQINFKDFFSALDLGSDKISSLTLAHSTEQNTGNNLPKGICQL